MPFDGAGYVPGECLNKLEEVIDLVGVPGRWCQGTLKTSDGRYCLRGAIMTVRAGALLEAPILQAINEVAGRYFYRIETFNDHANTDHALIRAVLLRTRENLLAGRTGVQQRRPTLYGRMAGAAWTLRGWRETARAWLGF